jgi:hypothetical protein
VRLMASYDFNECLAFSRGTSEETDIFVLRKHITGCIELNKTTEEIDKKGIDYIAILRNGATVKIDAKNRRKGCSFYWKEGPELALETWSVIPSEYNRGKVGWTLDEKKEIDLIFFKFDLSDTDKVYLLPYQLLRMAFRRNFKTWKVKYKTDIQTSNEWQSECLFVPAITVIDAITKEMQSTQ